MKLNKTILAVVLSASSFTANADILLCEIAKSKDSYSKEVVPILSGKGRQFTIDTRTGNVTPVKGNLFGVGNYHPWTTGFETKIYSELDSDLFQGVYTLNGLVRTVSIREVKEGIYTFMTSQADEVHYGVCEDVNQFK